MTTIVYWLLAGAFFASSEAYEFTPLSVKVPCSNRIQPIFRQSRSFLELIELSDVFIDKTSIIGDLINHHNYMSVLTGPAKWGKTILLDMIRVFMQIHVDENGNEILPRHNSPYYKLFTSGEITWTQSPAKLRNPLRISSYQYVIETFLGTHPVLYVNFRNISGITYEDLFHFTKMRIQSIFIEHQHMLTWLRNQVTANVTSQVKHELQRDIETFTNYTRADETLTYEALTKSFHFLGTLMWRRYRRQVVVLVDDYDVAYRNVVYQEKLSKQDCIKIMKFYREIYEQTMDQESTFLHQAILSGTFHLGKGSRLTPYLKSMRYHLLNNPYSKYYSFSQTNVDSLVEHFKIPQVTASQLKYWYGGYFTGKNFTRFVYNPMSIISFVQNKLLKSYQSKRETRDLLRFFMRIKALRTTFELLVNSQRLVIGKTRLCFSNNDIFHFRALVTEQPTELENRIPDIALAYLGATGYLSFASIQFSNFYDPFNVYVRVPNKEILYDLTERLITLYETDLACFRNAVDQVAEELVTFYGQDTNTSETLEQAIRAVFENVTLFYIPKPKPPPIVNDTLNATDILDTTVNPDTTVNLDTTVNFNTTVNINSTIKLNETFIYSILNFIAFKIRTVHRIQAKLPYHMSKNYMIITRNERHAMAVFKFTPQFDQGFTDPLQVAKINVPNLLPKFTSVKYIGIEVCENGTVHVNAETIRIPPPKT